MMVHKDRKKERKKERKKCRFGENGLEDKKKYRKK